MDGKRLKQTRIEMKMSQEDFSRFLGVSYQTLSRWERGICDPSRLATEKVERLLKQQKEYEHERNTACAIRDGGESQDG